MRKLIRHPAVQAGLARLLGAYIAFVARTTRWTLEGEGPVLAEIAAGRPLVVAFWHERLPVVPALFRLLVERDAATARLLPHVLVSRHRDGRFIGAAVERFGVRMVYGSTSRGGAQALVEMVRILRAGNPVLITPDGPRGPRRWAAPGVAQLAAMAQVPVLPVGAATSAHRILPSWDRMMLPLPFGRGRMVCGPLIVVPRDGVEPSVAVIAAALDAACAAADAGLGVRG